MQVEKLAFAVSLWDGAKRLSESMKTTLIGEIGIPFFLLLGFSVENGLKAYLELKSVPGKWKNSHDLSDLLDKAKSTGFVTSSDAEIFVRTLSVYHKEFAFRYPEKAGTANVFTPPSSIASVNRLLEDVALNFDPKDILGTASQHKADNSALWQAIKIGIKLCP